MSSWRVQDLLCDLETRLVAARLEFSSIQKPIYCIVSLYKAVAMYV